MPEPENSPDTANGTTTIADLVVRKIVGHAAREVPGVHALGSGTARVLPTITERVPGATTSVSGGVTAEIGAKQAALRLELVVTHGFPITRVADTVRDKVIRTVEAITQLEVVDVTIVVSDIWIPRDTATSVDQIGRGR